MDVGRLEQIRRSAVMAVSVPSSTVLELLEEIHRLREELAERGFDS